MPLYYADASALVKLVRTEPQSRALRAYLDGADLVTSAIALAEVPRALRRAAFDDDRLLLDDLLRDAESVLGICALLPVADLLLTAAGAMQEPRLRSLDAVHVAAAVAVQPIDGFVSYDQRQSAVARLAGLRTVAPGL